MGKFIDLTGQKFGDREVIEYVGNSQWLCRCKCGKESNVRGRDLLKGSNISCRECSGSGFKDLKGSVVGKWTVVEYIGNGKWKCKCSCGFEEVKHRNSLTRGINPKCRKCDGNIMVGDKIGEWTVLGIKKGTGKWKCRCSCGEISLISSSELRSKKLRKRCKKCSGKEFKDLTGEILGEWTVLNLHENRGNGKIYWKCRCSCGSEHIVRGDGLREGKSTKCVECGNNSRKGKTAWSIHGLNNTRIYGIWCGMKSRCYFKKHTGYKDYGGRGIKVCEEWLNNVVAFNDWAMQNGYSDDLTLDRINVDGDYEPSNCRWATTKEQTRNKRNNNFIEIGGDVKCVVDWAEEKGLDSKLLYGRLSKGWKPEDLLKDVRVAKQYEINGVSMGIYEWAEVTGIGVQTLIWRVKNGKTGEDIIKPVKNKKKRK